MKFTFKTEKPTGRYRSFDSDRHLIKLQGKEVGAISNGEGFKISLAVNREKTEDNPAPFKWIAFKIQFESLDEAKIWLNKNVKSILERYNIYKFEDYE